MRWGFMCLVISAAAAGALGAATVAIPDEIPSVALQAVAVYRLEVGGAILAVLYLVAITLVLSMNNRGFTEFGTKGVRAEGAR